MKQVDPIDVAGLDAALLSATELGLGSVLHSLHLPLSGQLLSLNQIFLLTRSTLKTKGFSSARTIAFQVSMIAALLKSLAPSGKKLTPMLAISMQGLLFSVGTVLFGANSWGIFVGATLASVWAFLQPVFILLFFFGSPLLDVGKYFFLQASEIVSLGADKAWMIVAGLFLLKIVAAWGAVFAGMFVTDSFVDRYQARLLKFRQLAPKVQHGSIGLSALRDLLNPLFLFSLSLTALFFLYVDSNSSQFVWAMLRPLAIGYVFFFLVRWLQNFDLKQSWFSRRIIRSFQLALDSVSKESP